ncbi:hypothetical protein Q9S36_49655 [Microbacterium sp. ARD31]|uniref:hypothetical protein n=1 Tax=Microbacterium sp. ARD31 TaxID=2962576 RepID=UPI00288237D5|nr:hypothetical protein [Microbacterium sp. ARD31]MDT0188283.1 hypothetical protein [Microbacterium sp. ARD31]
MHTLHKLVPTVLTTVALLVPVSLTAPAATAAPAEAGNRITGTWKGKVFGDNGASAGYRARVRIVTRNGELRGRIAYGGCYGTWRYKGRSGARYRFTEVITRDTIGGKCAKRVSVKVRRDDARLRVVWREPTSGDTATMLARKA